MKVEEEETERRRQQLDEVRLLQASVGEDEFAWRGSEGDVARMEAAVSEERLEEVDKEDGEERATALEFGLRLHAQPELWLVVAYPSPPIGAQSDTDHATGPQMYLSGPHLARDSLEQLKKALMAHEQEAKEQGFENVVFDCFTAVQSFLTDRPELVQADDGEGQSMDVQEQGQKRARRRERTPNIQMARVIFWTHHLKAPSKKRDMNSWCAELDVWGLVKSGYPGFLCFEGQAEDVEEMVRRIKALQWHAITVKTDERYNFTPTPLSHDAAAAVAAVKGDGMDNEEEEEEDLVAAALLGCRLAQGHSARPDKRQAMERAKVRTSMDEVESIKELLERLEIADVPVDEYQYALALRTKKAAPK